MDSMYELSQSSIGCSSDTDYDGASLVGAPVVNQDSSLSDSLISGPRHNTSVASVPPSAQDPNWNPTHSIPPIMPMMSEDLDSPMPQGGDGTLPLSLIHI